MIDTIDLLEAIGQDASLRHASAEELGKMLMQAQAPEALTAAVASGDCSPLLASFGGMQNQVTEGIFAPAREDDPGEETPFDVPVPERTPSPSPSPET